MIPIKLSYLNSGTVDLTKKRLRGKIFIPTKKFSQTIDYKQHDHILAVVIAK